MTKAESLGVPVIDEAEFVTLLDTGDLPERYAPTQESVTDEDPTPDDA